MELGLDYEASELDLHASETSAGLDVIARHSDGLVDETGVELSLDDLARE